MKRTDGIKRSRVIVLAAILCLCLACLGCSKKAEIAPFAPDNSMAYDPGDFSSSENNGYAPQEGANDEARQDILAGRKVIRNVELTVQTLDFDAFTQGMDSKIASCGGYVQSNVTGRDRYQRGSSLRTASMTVRIPADRLDEFLSTVEGLGNVIMKVENVNDVTESYVDAEARLASLRTEYETLLGLLEKAESLEAVITLQDRLSDVRYEIESYESRIRSYDSQIQYSTVKLEISEVERETAAEEETFGQEVKRRFSESMEDIGYGFTRFGAWLLGEFPVILLLLLLIVGIPALIVVLIVRASKKKKAKRLKAAETDKTVSAKE